MCGLAGIGWRLVVWSVLYREDLVAELDAAVADEHAWPSNQLPHLVMTFAAKGAAGVLTLALWF